MGGLIFVLWVLRFFVFRLYESPKYLIGRGRDADAVDIVHRVAAYNRRMSSLSLKQLHAVDKSFGQVQREDAEKASGVDTSTKGVIKRKLAIFSAEHVKALFATRKLAWSTSLLITLWGELPYHVVMEIRLY